MFCLLNSVRFGLIFWLYLFVCRISTGACLAHYAGRRPESLRPEPRCEECNWRQCHHTVVSTATAALSHEVSHCLIGCLKEAPALDTVTWWLWLVAEPGDRSGRYSEIFQVCHVVVVVVLSQSSTSEWSHMIGRASTCAVVLCSLLLLQSAAATYTV